MFGQAAGWDTVHSGTPGTEQMNGAYYRLKSSSGGRGNASWPLSRKKFKTNDLLLHLRINMPSSITALSGYNTDF